MNLNKLSQFPSENSCMCISESDDILQFIIKITTIPASVIRSDEKGMEKRMISMMTVLDGSMESIHKKKLRQSVQVNNDISE